MAVNIRVLRAIRDVVGLPLLPLERRVSLPTVMNSTYRRIKGVNEALAERMPVATGTDTETFAALYERAFARVYRRRATYRKRRGSHEAWLFGIARNAALDELRRRKRRARLEAEPEDTGALGADDHGDLALRREAVRAAMTTLDGPERDLIALKFSAGLSNSEIAKVLDVSETAVGTRLHRTLTK